MKNSDLYGIFFNLKAGNSKAHQIADQVRDNLNANGINTKLLTASTPTRAEKLIMTMMPDLTGLIVIGGDGTLNLAVKAMLKSKLKCPIGLIPAGTVNNFATKWQLPTDVNSAVTNILKKQVQPFSVGVINGEQVLISSLTFGNLADLSNEVRQQDKQRFGKIVYVGAVLNRIGKHKSYLIDYQIDDEPAVTLKTWFALLTMYSTVGGLKYSASAHNQMHLSILNNIHLKQVTSFMYFALTGRLNNSKAITYKQPTHLKLKSHDNTTVTTRIDGDPGVKLPIIIEHLPNYFEIFK